MMVFRLRVQGLGFKGLGSFVGVVLSRVQVL